jgi:hypothetical protein
MLLRVDPLIHSSSQTYLFISQVYTQVLILLPQDDSLSPFVTVSPCLVDLETK